MQKYLEVREKVMAAAVVVVGDMFARLEASSCLSGLTNDTFWPRLISQVWLSKSQENMNRTISGSDERCQLGCNWAILSLMMIS